MKVQSRRTMALLAAGCVLAAFVSLAVADGAYAAADVKNAGKNIADTLKVWSGALFGGVTGILAVFYLMARKVGPALGFAALAMLVGGFVFSPELMGDLSEGLYKTALK
jgi:hypothetical protein